MAIREINILLKSSIKEMQIFTVEKGKQSEEDRYKKLCERERERERQKKCPEERFLNCSWGRRVEWN